MHKEYIGYLASHGFLSPDYVNCLTGWAVRAREPIGMISVNHGLIEGEQIDWILDRQRNSRRKFGEIAVEMGLLSAEQVAVLLQIQRFRIVADLTEALALAEITDLQFAVSLMCDFLSRRSDCLSACGSPAA